MALGGRRLTIALLAGLVVVVLAGGIGALAISRHQRTSAAQTSGQPAATQTTTRSSDPGRPSALAESSAATRPSPAVQSDPISAPVGPSTDLTVQMSPQVRADSRSTRAQQLLQGFFDSINQHSYSSWAQVVTSAMAGRQSSAQWLQAYATTVDSSIWMQSIRADPLQVTLRFTSQQDPDLAPTELPVDCIHWTLTYQLVVQYDQLLVGSTVDDSVRMAKC